MGNPRPSPQHSTVLLADIDIHSGAGGPFHEHGDALAQDEELLKVASGLLGFDEAFAQGLGFRVQGIAGCYN